MEINAAQKPSSFVKIFQDGDVKVKTCLLLINTSEEIHNLLTWRKMAWAMIWLNETTFLKYKNGGKQSIFDIFQVIKSLRFQNISQIARSRLDWPIRLEASLFDHLLLPDVTSTIFLWHLNKKIICDVTFWFLSLFFICATFSFISKVFEVVV